MTRSTQALAVVLAMAAVWAGGCVHKMPMGSTFAEDVAFLGEHKGATVLQSPDGQARVAVSAAYQGRVMTSTAGGGGGISFGWINRELIASGKIVEHMNAYGGEDRIWLGPEGGQFSIFFKPKTSFDFKNWFTPAPIDTEPFELVSQQADRADFRRAFSLTNWSGTKLDVEIRRQVRLLDAAGVKDRFGLAAGPGVQAVAFESVNKLTNKGPAAWTKKTGLLSVWILGMYNASPRTTVVVPFVKGPVEKLGKVVIDDYFGKVPADRLKADLDKGVVYFKGDANHRGKIGFTPRRAKTVLGSYDAVHNVLTLVTYTKPAGETDYVNSAWALQDDPFSGDPVNCYCDGVNPEGKRVGNFYEMESSSPGAKLGPGQTLTHVHTIAHFQGDKAELDKMARAALGVGLEEIQAAFE